MTSVVAADLVEIRRALALLLERGTVAELRVPKTPWGTVSGFFDDHDLLAQAARALSGRAPAIYVTANPVSPDLLGRGANRIRRYVDKGECTEDRDVLRRCWFLLDFDPVRLADVSSTEAEHTGALDRASACMSWLIAIGFTVEMMILADSGNGTHLDISVQLPNDQASAELVERCLAAVACRFNDEKVVVDVKIGNASRIWKVYGTLAAKGSPTVDRPHRLARILQAPKTVTIAGSDLLQRLAATAGMQPKLYKRSVIGHTAPDAETLLVTAGHRNNWLTSLGGTLRRRGIGEAAMTKCLLAINEEQCDPPLDEDEVQGVAHSAARYPAGELFTPFEPSSAEDPVADELLARALGLRR